MSERRYSDEDARRILALAAEVDAATPAVGADGWTMPELQRAASEAGLSPESVAAAALTLERAASGDARYLGLPVAVTRAVPLQHGLSDADWARLVARLRDTFGAQGRLHASGAHREWRVGNLSVVHEPTAHGALLDLRTRKGDARIFPAMGAVFLSVSGAFATVGASLGGFTDGRWMGIGLLAALGAGLLVGGLARLPFWARERARQFESLGAFARRLAAPGPSDEAAPLALTSSSTGP